MNKQELIGLLRANLWAANNQDIQGIDRAAEKIYLVFARSVEAEVAHLIVERNELKASLAGAEQAAQIYHDLAQSAARIESLERDCRSYKAMSADAIHRMDAALVKVGTAQRQARFWQNAYEDAAIQLLAIKTNLTAIIEDY